MIGFGHCYGVSDTNWHTYVRRMLGQPCPQVVWVVWCRAQKDLLSVGRKSFSSWVLGMLASSHVELAEAFLSKLRLFAQLAFDGLSFYQQFWQRKNGRPFVFSEWHQQKPTKATRNVSLQAHRAKHSRSTTSVQQWVPDRFPSHWFEMTLVWGQLGGRGEQWLRLVFNVSLMRCEWMPLMSTFASSATCVRETAGAQAPDERCVWPECEINHDSVVALKEVAGN